MTGMLDFTGMDLDDSKEPTTVKPGAEVKLRITTVRVDTDKNGLDYIMPSLEVADDPYAKEFTHFMHVPDKENMTEKKLNQAKYFLKLFMDCFSIDRSRSADPQDDWPGSEGWAILGASESENWGEQNNIKKLIAPK